MKVENTNVQDMQEAPAIAKLPVSSSFDDDIEIDLFLSTQPILTEEEEKEQMDRINKGCDLIRKMGLTPNIPEPY